MPFRISRCMLLPGLDPVGDAHPTSSLTSFYEDSCDSLDLGDLVNKNRVWPVWAWV